MRLVTEFHNFRVIDLIAEDLQSVFDHVRIKGSTILASSLTDKSGNPLVRIDSKTPIKAIMIVVNEDSIEIKSIVNTKSERGLFNKIMTIFTNRLNPGTLIKVDQDVSGGFWNYQVKMYPQFNWEIN